MPKTFRFPSDVRDFSKWREQFEREFLRFVNARDGQPFVLMQHPMKEHPLSQLRAKTNGGFEILVDGVVKESWNP